MKILRQSIAGDVINSEFKDCFHGKGASILKKLDFIKKYIKAYEEAIENIFNVFYKVEPEKESKSLNHVPSEIDIECISLLIKLSKTRSDIEKYSLSGKYDDDEKVIAYHRGYAYALLGMVFYYGIFSVKIDIKKAVNFYICAFKHSNTLGTYRLALCFEHGIGRKMCYKNAIRFYRCAAKQGGPEAMHVYGMIMLTGNFKTEKSDFASGLHFLTMAGKMASEYYPHAYFDLGELYEKPGNVPDVIKDDDYAFKLYSKGAALGCSKCLYRIARCYERGELNCEKNVKEMLLFYDKAASMFHPMAMHFMALQYAKGNDPHIQKNIVKAFKLALKAAFRKHIKSIVLVAEILENESIFKCDLNTILWWYKMADSMEYKPAKQKIQELQNVINNMKKSE